MNSSFNSRKLSELQASDDTAFQLTAASVLLVAAGAEGGAGVAISGHHTFCAR
jgi:hypothetical protein